MKPLLIRLWIRGRYKSGDPIGIRPLIAIGIIGQLIVFLIPNPARLLAPQLPLLSPQDWPGSQIGTEVFFTDSWRASPSDPWSPLQWEEKRGFYQSLNLTGNNVNASFEQTILWFANPDGSAAAWNQLDSDTYNGWPVLERRRQSEAPVSILACNPDSSIAPQCWYLTYWEHWFSAVFFWRQSGEDLLLQDIHQLTARLDYLLLSAPAEPCFWFLCTGPET